MKEGWSLSERLYSPSVVVQSLRLYEVPSERTGRSLFLLVPLMLPGVRWEVTSGMLPLRVRIGPTFRPLLRGLSVGRPSQRILQCSGFVSLQAYLFSRFLDNSLQLLPRNYQKLSSLTRVGFKAYVYRTLRGFTSTATNSSALSASEGIKCNIS